MKTYLLIDYKSKTKFINEFFVCAKKIPSFKPKKPINFTLKNNKVVYNLPEKPL